MITLLETVGPAILRASWQASVLALAVVLLVRSLRERIAPRWRYLLWSIVVIRLLLVATPASPWSAFNLVRSIPEVGARRIALHEADAKLAPDGRAADRDARPATGRSSTGIRSPRDVESVAKSRAPAMSAPAISSPIPPEIAPGSLPSRDRPPRVPPIVRILSSVCLAGCLLSGLQLSGTALVLRRRLSACRPVTRKNPPQAAGIHPERSGGFLVISDFSPLIFM